MTDQKPFAERDHEKLLADDMLSQAIGQWRDEAPARDLWPGVATRLAARTVPRGSHYSFTLAQLTLAASLLMAVGAGVTWLGVRQPSAPGDTRPVVIAQGEAAGEVEGTVVNANFADAQFNAAVSDLEQILRSERDRLDPRTVLVIERNLKTIDAAIQEARMALDGDPANAYLNSHLADARQRKLALLRHATTLASTGGN